MPGIIEGYNYDVFISYRQKDNKYDGWVTKFVDHLKKELEATFKEDVSIYFDENPLDGLLETYDVDKSLRKKLRCLIFIPIISQTYCDLKSYAWQHELCAFNKLAKEDKFGRDITLSGGNVASRILPVKIHELDPEDLVLLENELGGFLRSIEFIFTSVGVNRPLRANEDHPQDNLNKTYYRDQINKVANAIKEIITALKRQNLHAKARFKQVREVKSNIQKNLKTRAIIGTLIFTVLIIFGYLIVLKPLKSPEHIERSIAVLPFRNDTPVDSNKYFIDGIMEEALLNLQAIKDLRVLSRTSVEQYRNTTRSIPEIASELGVNYIVEGSGQKYGSTFRLRVQLISAKGKEAHIWAKVYEQEIRETKDIFAVQSQIAQAIAGELKALVTPEEKQIIEKTPTTDLQALFFYQQGKEELNKIIPGGTNKTNPQIIINNEQALDNARKMFMKALDCDSTFALAYIGLARTGVSADSLLILADKALYYDKHLPEAYIYRAGYFYSKDDYIKAYNEFDKAIKINPNYWEAYYWIGYLSREQGDLLKAIENLHKAASLNRGSQYTEILFELSRSYRRVGFFDKSKEIALEVLKMNGDSGSYFSMIIPSELFLGNFQKALELGKRAYAIDSSNVMASQQLGEIYERMSRWEEALKYWKRREALGGGSSLDLGYAYLKNGFKKEAENYFTNHIQRYKGSSNPYGLLGFAAIFLVRGEKEKAYEYLKKCSQLKMIHETIINRMNYPWFDSIRNEPEYQKIYTEIKAKFQAQNERIGKELKNKGLL